MKINSLVVNGKLHMKYDFTDKNVLLGSNYTGKSTFVKLLMYSLGVDIQDFIDEIIKEKYCESVVINFTTKQNKRFQSIRKLPYADIVMVIPYDDQNEVMREEEIQVFNLNEYSDFFLNEEQYHGGMISYGKDSKASLRYKFLLRTAVVDQSTEHRKILANMGASNDYIANQTLINKAIIEKILSQNNEEAQSLRLELNAKQKERTELNNREKFFKELVNEFKQSDDKWPTKLEKVKEEMDKLDEERDNLSSEKYKVLLRLEQQGDKTFEKIIIENRKELNKLKEQQAKYKLEIVDVEGILSKLKNELVYIKYNIAAKKVIQNIPVTICPVCFSELGEENIQEGLCHNCKEHNTEQILQSLAMYKKMIEESIVETESLKRENDIKLKKLKQQINEKEKKLKDTEIKYYEKLSDSKQPMEVLIREIKERIELITGRYYKLADLKKNLIELNKIYSKKESLVKEIDELRESLDEASKKNENDLIVLTKWKTCFQKLYTEISGTEDIVTISDEDYMPLIGENPMSKVSSESMKLVVQLSYILSLFQLQKNLDKEKINNIGFVVFDSPKDKDLDKDKYERFLKCLSKSDVGQIFLTGSDKDEESYLKAFDDNDFLSKLSDDDKLLKND
ncbi:MAG: hypothetical protein K0R15_1620 [Clostridiales bacterium]|jgi:hypothetical protein|nr:hypothetical protein [Clostridiales bacterium]